MLWTTQNTQRAMLLEIEYATSADKTILNLAVKSKVTKHQTDAPLKLEPINNRGSRLRTTWSCLTRRHGDAGEVSGEQTSPKKGGIQTNKSGSRSEASWACQRSIW
ncbi:hypothetical protein ISN44_As07g006560 [Arabidopsis suecica]|uniref:Uncharacterized protein n=1 Tax=Arabidopsis suecica TaxID=45249 RepID=A0A8T2BRH5_ARASU|nr:hypothetical protein ISN44_As07g006560 [Arabidopsis suecica]